MFREAHTTESASRRRRWLEWATNNALVGAVIVVAIQLWQLRGIVHARDLEDGDTVGYYGTALDWLRDGTLDPVHSPLYAVILGSLHAVLGDVQSVNMIVRVGTVLVLDLLLLAFLRRVLPRDIALLLVAWWASLPLVYDSLYTVHILGLVLPVAALALAARDRQHRHTAWVLMLLVLAGVLVRPEYFIPAALYGAFLCMRWARDSAHRQPRKPGDHQRRSRISAALVLVVVVAALVGMSNERDVGKVRAEVADRAALNMCQHYANYIVLVDPTWQVNPWTECSQVIERDFGGADISFGTALRLNPAAVGRFVEWNVRGIPAELQMALFDHYSAGANPAFEPHANARWAPPALAGAIVLALVGLLVLIFTPFGRRLLQLRSNPDPVVVLVTLLVLAGYIGLTFRPRPIWTAGLTLTVMVLIGVTAAFLLATRPRLGRMRGVIVLVALGLTFAIPQHFDATYATHFSSVGQPLVHKYDALRAWIPADDSGSMRVRLFGVDPLLCWYVFGRASGCEREPGGAEEFRVATRIEPIRCGADRWVGAVVSRTGRLPSTLQECVAP